MIERIKTLISDEYPSAAADTRTFQSLEFVTSPQIVRLPKSILPRAQAAIDSLYAFSRSEDQLQRLKKALKPDDLELIESRPKNNSVLMSYDFHYNPEGDQLSLIEINTNAALFMFSELIYRAHDLQPKLINVPLSSLLDSFQSEAAAAGKTLRRVHLIDEDVQNQRAYSEFLMFMEFFKKNSIEGQILDVADVKVLSQDALIYNRYTDFTFSKSTSQHFRKAFIDGTCIFSPNPWEYLVLADKDRMQDFSEHGISPVVIPQNEFRKFSDAEALWTERKKYFFKPKRSHGAKSVFNGASISKKRFLEIFNEDYVAQEFRPPAEIDGWKYDLRFYVYKNQIQLYIARLYKGQLTNFSTSGGGLAAVDFY